MNTAARIIIAAAGTVGVIVLGLLGYAAIQFVIYHADHIAQLVAPYRKPALAVVGITWMALALAPIFKIIYDRTGESR